MGGRGKGRQLVRIECRICEAVINQQRYPDHLKRLHPDADPQDRQVFGKAMISDIGKTKQEVEESIVHDDKVEDDPVMEVDEGEGLDLTLEGGAFSEKLL